MPEFFAEHVPSDLDEFTTGYLECAEWLAQSTGDGMDDRADFSLTDSERAACNGFTRKAIATAKRDCKAFQKANAADLELYAEHVRPLGNAGHDFWLTRNRHGAGFWDRKHSGNVDADSALDRLTDSAHGFGETECDYYRRRLHFQ